MLVWATTTTAAATKAVAGATRPTHPLGGSCAPNPSVLALAAALAAARRPRALPPPSPPAGGTLTESSNVWTGAKTIPSTWWTSGGVAMDARHVSLTSALLGGGGIEAPEKQVDDRHGFIFRAWASTDHNQAPTSTQVDWYLCTCKPGHSSTLKLLKIEVTVTLSSGRRLDNADVSSGARRLTASSVQVAHTLSLHKSNFRCPPLNDFSMEPSFINGMTTGRSQ